MATVVARGAVFAVVLAAVLPPASMAAGERPPNVLLLSIDTLRADRVAGWGCPRATTPSLDALAARGVSFARVITESSWTLPSHMTLMTGLYPTSHGVTLETMRLGEGVPTIAEVFRGAGYRTAAYTEGGFVGGDYGFARGFEIYDDRPKELRLTLYRATKFLQGLEPSEPWFVFVHTYAVHCPYHPPEEYAQRFRTRPDAYLDTEGKCGNPDYNRRPLSGGQNRFLRDQYDAGVRAADDQLKTFLRFLDERDVSGDTILLVVSDHGEEFGEHGRIGHERTLYLESLHVPMILVAPGISPAVIATPVGLTDVVPTLCELAGVGAPPGQGRSLVEVARAGTGAGAPRPQFSELDRDLRLRSVLTGNRHLILDLDVGRRSLFDLASDPWERASLSGSAGAELEAVLVDHLDRLPAPGEVPTLELDEARLEELRALGYVK